ncbi:MAG: DUF4111 domain-containing protein [Anaerolineae bacterium]
MNLPPEVEQGLTHYVQNVRAALPGSVIAVYLHGSVALGDFQPASSDLDFITVVDHRLDPSETERLRTLHEGLRSQYPGCRLSGGYLQRSDLGKSADAIEPFPYEHEGIFHVAGRWDINRVTWWILKNRPVVLDESTLLDFEFEMDWDAFRAEQRENLRAYWARFRREPRRLPGLMTDSGIEWMVLGPLRLAYSIQEQDIASKTQAGEYALRKLPTTYHRVIEEALRIRHSSQPALYRSRWVRALEAHRLLGFVLREWAA